MFCFSVRSLPTMALLCISQKYSAATRIFKNLLLEHSDPPFRNEFVFNNVNSLFLARRRVQLCQSAEWHILSFERISPGYLEVVIQSSINNFTNRIRIWNLSTPHQLTACHKWCCTTFYCLSTFSQSLHYEECPR